MIVTTRGFGEVGIALGWQPGDQGFESPKLHQCIKLASTLMLVLILCIIMYDCHKKDC